MNCFMSTSWSVAQSLLLCGCLLSTGCSSSAGPVDMGGEEGSLVASAVEELNEVKHSPKKSAEFFVTKQSADSTKKLNHFSYYVAGKPTINGTSATCKVLIERSDGTPLGDQEWTFEKVDNRWKIKSALLP